MIAKLKSYGINGINGYMVEIEADINIGLPSFEMVGLPDAAIKESKERVRSAIKNSLFDYPTKKITINLAPADQRKIGTFYDLPISISILAASGQIDIKFVKDYIMFGELALDGKLRKINGLLPMLIAAKTDGAAKFIVPVANLAEAQYLTDIEVYGLDSLEQTVEFLKGERKIDRLKSKDIMSSINNPNTSDDFKYIKGQLRAKRAMEIAAAGGHNIILVGPPGAGKTMLAKALPGILPDMTAAEALETTKIHSVAGVLDDAGIVTKRPFRTPHHTATTVALTGGSSFAKPGEMSLAHNGVLYLDELPEYTRQTVESLRQPLEDGIISVSRAAKTVSYPANFMLVASMNPCPCGYYGSKKGNCKCQSQAIQKYLSKLSGPLLDRIDLNVEVESVEYADLADSTLSEETAKIKERVNKARVMQTERYKGLAIYSNARMSQQHIKEFCALSNESSKLMSIAFDTLKLTARAYNRILKVSRTIADLAGSEKIEPVHIAEAIQFRSPDKKH